MYLLNEDTICAPATVPGTGAISVIRVSGGEALHAVSSIVRCAEGREIASAPGYSVRFGRIYLHDGQLLDEVLATVFRAPHSYTGEDSVEISCHASKYIVENILLLLAEAGVRHAAPGEFTRRAFLNGKMDLAQAEAVADLIASTNASAHHLAVGQLKGGFSSRLKKMRSDLLNIVSLMELELDFSEEDVEFADRKELESLVDSVTRHIDSLISSFRIGNAIRTGIPVAIAGATNTGKSTLLNALTGEDRAIVSDIHGTTRDTIEETLNVGGLLFRFIDTAGLRKTDEVIERIGIDRTFRKIEEATVVVVMADLTQDAGILCGSIREVLEKTDPARQKVIFALNKTDRFPDLPQEFLAGPLELASIPRILDDNKNVIIINKIVSFIEKECNKRNIRDAAVVFMSARGGEGIDTLKDALSALCSEYLASTDSVFVTNIRHIEALRNTRTALARVREGLDSGLPGDLVAQDIREALYHIGTIVGEISTDEVLGNIFKNFCVGK